MSGARLTAIEAGDRISVSYLQGAPPDRARKHIRELIEIATNKLLDEVEDMANSLDADEELRLRVVFEVLDPADVENPKG